MTLHSQQSEARIHNRSHAWLDLAQAVLYADMPYVWNPAEAAAEEYFMEAEAQLDAEGMAAPELAQYAQAFEAAAFDLFAQHDRTSLCATLVEKFAQRVPQELLDGIVRQAQAMVKSQMSIAERLIACVQDALPHWSADDLQVLARPYAFAMRDRDYVSETLNATAISWEQLSEMDRARLSLAIARYALDELK
ncbi:hypothetical protein [Geitlerinema sp. PCC 7407]|uniref:hypothetical protein n=1 Tax=Geitlerinema sp. PCC 7407 TaxID=1173025 RepID=UPI00029F907A|nr:hypothetical protein [Geitlerinema sp. PCC 7407]AFY67885.1 hypothetical protein GEI7407_3418 [Geitlerinema sp. PCC 7407]